MESKCYTSIPLIYFKTSLTPLIPGVLVLAEIEVDFFTAACMVLRFRFVTKAVLLIQECFSNCWAVLAQNQGHLCFSCCPHSQQHDWRLGGRTAGPADHHWPKGCSIPHSIILSNKTEGSWSKVAIAQWLAGHWSAGGRWWVMPLHQLVVGYVGFFLIFLIISLHLLTVFILAHEFLLTIALPILSAIPPWRME